MRAPQGVDGYGVDPLEHCARRRDGVVRFAEALARCPGAGDLPEYPDGVERFFQGSIAYRFESIGRLGKSPAHLQNIAEALDQVPHASGVAAVRKLERRVEVLHLLAVCERLRRELRR